MLHKAWSCIEEVPYCFWRSSVKYQGHTGWKRGRFESNLSKITRPVAAIKSPRFALFIQENAFENVVKCCKMEAILSQLQWVNDGDTTVSCKITRLRHDTIIYKSVTKFLSVWHCSRHSSNIPCSIFINISELLYRSCMPQSIYQ